MNNTSSWQRKLALWIIGIFIFSVGASALPLSGRSGDANETGMIEKEQAAGGNTIKKSGFPWLWVIGGAVAAAVVVYLLVHKSSDDQEDPDLQLEWLFSGNAQDSSGKNRHGTVYGASAVPDRKGAANGAYSFNGSSHYIEGPNFIAQKNNQISVSFWIKTAVSPYLIRFPIMSNDFAISQYISDISMAISIPATNSARASVTQQVWTHFAGTYNGTEIRIYKNGALAASKSHPGNISNLNRNFSAGRFGTEYWSGAIDDIRVYSRVLSQTDITKLYSE